MPGSPIAIAKFIELAISYVGSDCLLWPFAKNQGYGRVERGYAHVLICKAAHGPKPSGHEVAHNCGVRACVNPAHLRWDTPKGNQADQIAHFFGQHSNAKLTFDDVQRILSEPHRSKGDLAKEYDVTKGTIAHIRHKRNWRWIHE